MVGRMDYQWTKQHAIFGRFVRNVLDNPPPYKFSPENVLTASVVGYDNTYLSRIRHLSLTSVDNGNFAVGVQAGKFLLERLDSPHLPQRIHLVGNSLHVRRSTGTAPIPS